MFPFHSVNNNYLSICNHYKLFGGYGPEFFGNRAEISFDAAVGITRTVQKKAQSRIRCNPQPQTKKFTTACVLTWLKTRLIVKKHLKSRQKYFLTNL